MEVSSMSHPADQSKRRFSKDPDHPEQENIETAGIDIIFALTFVLAFTQREKNGYI